MNDFPSDEICHDDRGILGSFCLNPATHTLFADGGGWVAKLCEEHFGTQIARWQWVAHDHAKRLADAEVRESDSVDYQREVERGLRQLR